MLEPSLSDIPVVMLLRSDKILRETLNSLTSSTTPTESTVLTDGVSDFFPNRFRRNQLDAAVKSVMPGTFSCDYSYRFLHDVFTRFFRVDYPTVTAHENMAARYSSLSRYVHPSSIIGYHLSCLLKDKTISLGEMKEFCRNIPSLAIKVSYNEDYADNHVHIRGCIETPSSLLDLANRERTPDALYLPDCVKRLRLHDLTQINEGYLSLGQLADILKESLVVINRYTLYGFRHSIDEGVFVISEILKGRPRHAIKTVQCNLSTVSSLGIDIPGLDRDVLRFASQAFCNGNDDTAWLAYNTLLYLLHENEAAPLSLRCLIKVFLHAANILRSYMVMSQNVGLTHFVEFFNSPVKTKRNSYQDISRSIVLNGTNHIEGKISPSDLKTPKLANLFFAFEDTKPDNAKLRNLPGLVEHESVKFHFSVHFLREKDFHFACPATDKGHPTRLSVRHNKLRTELKRKTDALTNFLFRSQDNCPSYFEFCKNQEGWRVRALREREQLSKNKIFLPHLVATLDVAGDENNAPPEVFAPSIRYLRSEKISAPSTFAAKPELHEYGKNLHLSVHAGEDFNHIITGLRRIDETIRFFEMGDNDRLGHALALGLYPEEWVQHAPEVLLTAEEQLDDLVWLWHYTHKLETEFSKNGSFYDIIVLKHQQLHGLMKSRLLSARFEKEVIEVGTRIYGRDYGAKNLFDAWILRRNCPLEAARGSASGFAFHERVKRQIPDFIDSEEITQEAFDIFSMYHRDFQVRENAQKQFCSCNGSLLPKEDRTLNDAQMELIECIQDLFMAKCNDLGIIIETNPSSNVSISSMSSYKVHPIFRWNPVSSGLLEPGNDCNRFGIRNGPNKVCINSDDPAVFVTTLQNEFRLIHNAAQEKYSYYPNDIAKWIDEIREFGLQIFNKSYKTPFI